MSNTSERAVFDDPRLWRQLPTVTLTPDMRGANISAGTCGTGEFLSLDEAPRLEIYRRGIDTLRVAYDPFELRQANTQATYVFDAALFSLPPGRYEMRFVPRLSPTDPRRCDPPVPCAQAELVIPKGCAVANAGLEAGGLPVLHTTKPAGVLDMFDAIATFSGKLHAVLEIDSNRLPLEPSAAAILCGATLCKPAQLVVYDGVKSEIVEFASCSGGNVIVTRGVAGTEPRRFPAGSVVSFSWTPDNVAAACTECP